MPTIPERLETATALVEADSTKLHSIVHGASNAADVVTEGGNVKPIAKVIAEGEAALAASVGSMASAVTESAASATAAAASQTAAAASQSAAATSASAAATSATAASGSATTATTQATTATTQAGAASTSATAAAGSATAAAGSATTASTQATNAGNSATAAATSATNASTSATAAATSATNAGTSATAAASSATAAATSATNASSSASAASTSAAQAAAIAAGLNYKGMVAGASVAATSTAAGDCYLISSAGTSQSKTWAEGDLAVYRGSSGNWDQIPATVVVGIAAALRNALAPRGGVSFSGAAARIHATIAGQSPGVDQFSVVQVIRVPNTAIGPLMLASLLPTLGNYDQGRAFNMSFESANNGTIRVNLRGATGSDYIVNDYHNIVTRFAGKDIVLGVTRGSTGDPKLYINGVLQVKDATLSGGTAPTWQDTVTGEVFVFGSYNGTLYQWQDKVRSLSYYNLALSAADMLEVYELGGGVPEKYKFGSKVPYHSSDFSVNAGIWGSSVGATVTGNQDGINGQDDWVRSYRNGSSGTVNLLNSTLNAAIKKVLRFRARVFRPSGTTWSYIGPFFDNASGTQPAAILVPENTEVDIDVTYTPQSSSLNGLRIVTSAANNADLSVADGSGFYAKNITYTQLGAVMHLPLDDGIGYQLHDDSTNKLDAVMTPTGITHVIPKYRGFIRKTLTWAGTHEAKTILGQRCYPSEIWLTALIVRATVATSGTGMKLGVPTNDERQLAATPLPNYKIQPTGLSGRPGTDDTGCNLQVDPDSVNYTGTIHVYIGYESTQGSPEGA